MISGYRKRNSNITVPISREERIQDIRETIKVNEVLIRIAEDLLNPDSPCSFQVYLRELDSKINTLRDERKSLIASYDAASNGEIPSLQQQQESLQEKLKQLRADISGGKIRTKKRKSKVKDLRARLSQLERELADASNFDIEELLKEL